MNGTTIGPYKLVRELGRGGMGTVVLAEDLRLGRRVALKTVSGAQAGTPAGRAQLLAEARAAAAIAHPAIAAVHDVVEHDGDIAIVFEYVEGQTLAARLESGPLPEDEAVRVGGLVADALAAAHGHGVLHRDLKPSNIMLAPGGVVKILDFGIARVRPTDAAAAEGDEGFMGTPGYVAPEQWVGTSVDPRSDLYALGVVIFEMLTGRRPFPEREPLTLALASIDRIALRVSSVKPGVTPGLDKLVARLLAADPSLRPPHARVVADELRALLTPAAASVSPSRWRVALVAGIVAFGVAGAAWVLSRPEPLDAQSPVIAVLPLANATGATANDYLAAGVADSLVTSLASLPTVTVLSRSTVDDALTRRTKPGDVAREVGATFVVDGSVQATGTELRIGVSLIRQDGSVAWSDAVQGAASGVFEMQARLAAALGGALSLQMSPADRQRLGTPPTSNPAALDAYWRGRALLERRDTPGNLQRSVVAFNEALRQDARFPEAMGALAEAYWELYQSTNERQWADLAVQTGRNALVVAPGQPSVRLALARTLVDSGRNAEAIDELQRTLVMQPANDEALRQLGRALSKSGRLEEAIAEWRKAVAVRPNNWQVLADMGLALFQSARYDEAETVYRQLVDLQPDNASGFHMLGTIQQMRGGNDDAALALYEQAIAIRPVAQAFSNMGVLLHRRGDFAKAVTAFTRALEERQNSAATHRNLGDSLLQLGRTAEAKAAFRRAADLAEAARVVNPTDVQNLASLAVYLQKAGEDDLARQRLDDAVRRAPDDPQVWHRAALVHALAARHDPALEALGRAVSLGYSRADAAKDDEFAALRASPRFQAIVGPAR